MKAIENPMTISGRKTIGFVVRDNFGINLLSEAGIPNESNPKNKTITAKDRFALVDSVNKNKGRISGVFAIIGRRSIILKARIASTPHTAQVVKPELRRLLRARSLSLFMY